jgi:uracil-DNA glycosylase
LTGRPGATGEQGAAQRPEAFADLLAEVRGCRACAAMLPLGPRPVLAASPTARLLIAGQAPGRRVHQTGIPWNDPSGDRLRRWLGLDRDTFYDAARVAILPMGFCYPGTGPSGDLPPRPECAPLWRRRLLAAMPGIELTVACGRYAHRWHAPGGRDVTATVRNWQADPAVVPLPHPSPRNISWFRRNPWFEVEVLPALRTRVAAALAGR